MQEFVYERPETVAEAVAAMRAGDARALAGGTDLVPQLREGRRTRRAHRRPEACPGPDGDRACCPTAACRSVRRRRATAVARHAAIAARYPAVAESAQLIGGVQVQNRASLGGNICNAAPSADGVPALICHGAQALIAGPGGTREMPVEAMFAGPGRTTLGGRRAAGRDPAAAGAARARPRPICASRRGARWTSRWRDAGPGCGSATMAPSRRRALVLASVAPTPIRAPSAERKLVGERPGARAVRGGRPARRAGCASDLGYARLRRLSPHAGRRADGARARRLRPPAWSRGRGPHEDAAQLHRQRRGARACSPTRATRCSICCATGSA